MNPIIAVKAATRRTPKLLVEFMIEDEVQLQLTDDLGLTSTELKAKNAVIQRDLSHT